MANSRELVLRDPQKGSMNRDGDENCRPDLLTIATIYTRIRGEGEQQGAGVREPLGIITGITSIPALKEFKTGKVLGWTERNDLDINEKFENRIDCPDIYRLFMHSWIGDNVCTDSIFPVVGETMTKAYLRTITDPDVRNFAIEDIKMTSKLADDAGLPTPNGQRLYKHYNKNIILVLEEQKLDDPRLEETRVVVIPNGTQYRIQSQRARLLCLIPRAGEFSPVGKVHRILDIHHKLDYNVIGLLADNEFDPNVVRLTKDCIEMVNLNHSGYNLFGYLVSKESLFLVSEILYMGPRKAYNTLLKEYNFLILEGSHEFCPNYSTTPRYNPEGKHFHSIERLRTKIEYDCMPYPLRIVVIGEGVNLIVISRGDGKKSPLENRISNLFLYEPKEYPSIIDWQQFHSDFYCFPFVDKQFKQIMNENQIHDYVTEPVLLDNRPEMLLFSLFCKSYWLFDQKTKEYRLVDHWNVYMRVNDTDGDYIYLFTLALEYKYRPGTKILFINQRYFRHYPRLFSETEITDEEYRNRFNEQELDVLEQRFINCNQTLTDVITLRLCDDLFQAIGRKEFLDYQRSGWYTWQRFAIKAYEEFDFE